uniref:Signal recognition particle 19 kDa protein n=1 Tax=Panagrellus redivivus TaxID=6233 RepID=A0A7E4UP17_PANRE
MATVKPHSDESRWITIYPVYINKKKTKFEGRKIPVTKAVENPTLQEITDILNHEGLKIKQEPMKLHPRDQNREPGFHGRIRVQLKNDDGTPVKANFPTRTSLLEHVATFIPKLKSRQQPTSSAGPSGGGGGKKKRR